MKEKMRRFLNSIGINDIEHFDIDFDSVSRNIFDRNQVDMQIVKTTPWDFQYLEEFQNGLNTIGYPYTLRFSYVNSPNVYDAIKLFDDWHQAHNRFQKDFYLDGINDIITFIFSSDEKLEQGQVIVQEFKEFLDFLNYPFSLETSVKYQEVEETKKVSEKQLKKLEEKATKIIEQNAMLEVNDSEKTYFNDQREIEEEKKDELAEFEQNYLKEMKANYKRMLEERKAKKVWQKGDYVHFDDLSKLNAESGNVDINGELFSLEDARLSKNGKVTRRGAVGSGTSAITLKLIESGKILPGQFIKDLQDGMNIRVRGAVSVDNFNNENFIMVHYLDILPPSSTRVDKEKEKRVELHLHTKMSTMDGVSDIDEYCKVAKSMGHKAIAVTDHGVVQAFPMAQKAAKDYGLKMIYGAELYMVNDELPFGLNPSPVELMKANYVIFDLETTGLSARHDRIIEFGAVRVEKGNVLEL